MAGERKRVLVVGGSGYLGQHLLAALASAGDVDVAFTHHRDAAPLQLLEALPGVRAFRVDLRSGDGLEAVSASFGQVTLLPVSSICLSAYGISSNPTPLRLQHNTLCHDAHHLVN
jgi:nucleoside-diphosphate-sugar epimerase